MAQAVRLPLQQRHSPQKQLLDYLHQKTMLLVLDNFEHLIEGAGTVVQILKTAPRICILVTSRTPLNVRGEHLFPVKGLDFPKWLPTTLEAMLALPAVRLFVSAAALRQPGFELTLENLTGVARICRLAAGMPLAILLAASWVGIVTPTEIAAETERDLDFLEIDWQGVPERQRSMRAAFDYSWGLLPEAERGVLAGLSVFRGSFSRQAAEWVTDSTPRTLRVLADRSLLQPLAAGRFEMHELLRQYARGKLEGDASVEQKVRDRHYTYYGRTLQMWWGALRSTRRRAVLQQMDAEIEDARAAWDRAVVLLDVNRMLEMIDTLGMYHWARSRYEEGQALMQSAVDKLAVDDGSTASADRLRVQSRALAWLALMSWPDRAIRQLTKESLALLDRPELAHHDVRQERAFALYEFGYAEGAYHPQRAIELLRQSLLLYETLDDRWWVSELTGLLSHMSGWIGDYRQAREWAVRSLAIREALGDGAEIATGLRFLRDVAQAQGCVEEAESLMRRAVRLWQETGIQDHLGMGLSYLGGSLVMSGKFAEAAEVLQHSLRESVSPVWVHGAHGALSDALVGLGRYKEARLHALAGLRYAQGTDFAPFVAVHSCVLARVTLVEKAYVETQELLQGAITIFGDISFLQGVGVALAMVAYAERGVEQQDQAWRSLHEALAIGARIGAYLPLVYAIPAVALLASDTGHVERAIEFYALASRHPFVANSRWFEDVVGKHIAAAAESLSPEVIEAAKERGRARDLWKTAKELLAELESGEG